METIFPLAVNIAPAPAAVPTIGRCCAVEKALCRFIIIAAVSVTIP